MGTSDDRPWDGTGLPPSARSRIAHAAESRAAGSLLSVPDTTALAAVGFSPIGEVMGCMVEQIGWRSGMSCGASYGWNEARTLVSGGVDRWKGLGPYVEAVYRGWHTALRRLLLEATALGADGVVGIRLSRQTMGIDSFEFLALGTAVRGTGARATRPFTTDLSGADVSKLLHAGWVPTGIAVGIAAALRHDDYLIRRQRGVWANNTPIDGYTDLVNAARHQARTQFEAHARTHGGEVALVSSMDLKIWEQEPSKDHTDHVAEATIIGTVATSYRRTPMTPRPSILPLDRTKETRR